MTEQERMAAKYKGTAFEILYAKPTTSKDDQAAERRRAAERIRGKARRDALAVENRHNLSNLSDKTKALRDNKQFSRWAI